MFHRSITSVYADKFPFIGMDNVFIFPFLAFNGL